MTETDQAQPAVAAPSEIKKPWRFRLRGSYGVVFILPCALLALLSAPHVRQGSWGDVALDSLGWLLFLAGTGLRFWATLYVGGRKSRELVCDGPYSACRHPLYMGTSLLFLSIAAFFGSITVLGGTLLSLLAYQLLTIPAEEDALREKLGQAYDDYARTTPRLWPRLSKFRSPETVSFTVKSLAIESRRAMRWIIFPLALELLNHVREMPWWPHPLSLL